MHWEQADSEALFRACADGDDPSAWDEFVRRYGDLIARTTLRVSRRWTEATPDLVEDLVQETYLKLCASGGRALRSFRALHDGADFGFVKVFAANVVLDHFRSRNAKKRGGSATLQLSVVPEPAIDSGGIDQALALHDIQECLDRNATGPTRDRDHWVFHLYYRHGFTAQAIAQLPAVGLSADGVESLLGRLVRMLKAHLAGPPGGGPPTIGETA